MALPLPRVVADVGPGGGLVTAMGGMNSLANDNILRQINQIKKQYMPLTTQADIASKNAYAALVGLQPLGKILGNEMAYSNVPDPQKQEINNRFLRAGGVGPLPFPQTNNANSLNQIPQNSGVGQPSTNSFSGYMQNIFRNLMGKGQQPTQQQNNPSSSMPQANQQQQFEMPQAQTTNVPDQSDNIDHDLDAKYLEWLQSPQGQEPNAISPTEQELRSGSWKQNNTLKNPAINLELTSGQRGTRQPTWSETTGKSKGIVKEGEELGKIRAKNIDELDQQYQQAVQSEVPLKHMNEIVSNPAFQKLRQFPWFQGLQLDAKAKMGTPKEQKLIGDFQTTALKAVAETVMGFKGRILDKEVSLANDMKINKNDTIGVMLGKLPSIETFQEMTKQRSRIASKLMREQHLNRGDAIELADKQINGAAIRRKVENELNPITEDDIDTTARENNMTREQVIQRLKSEGRYNG